MYYMLKRKEVNMYYSAFIEGVKPSLQDPKIDSISFNDEEEAKDFIMGEYEGKYGITLQPQEIELFVNACQRERG